MKRVLIIKPSALGDVIQATCMLPVIKEHDPDIHISWLVFEHNKEVVVDHPLLDEVITLDRYGGVLKAWSRTRRQMRQMDFDTVIDIQCLLRSALLSFVSGCTRRIGFANGRELSTLFYTETCDIPTRSMHAVDGYLALCETLGMKRPEDVRFPLPIKERHRQRVESLFPEEGEGECTVVVCPTAGWPSKCWPEASFAALADMLVEERRARILLVGAPGEKEAVGRVAGLMQRPCLDLSGKLSLMEVAALLERSDLFVGNDSGLMHMASATRTPCVAVFGPTDPGRTGPYNPLSQTIQADLECVPCFRKHCREMTCMKEISPETVERMCLDRLMP
ncbi:MAG: lipopolysaccharide heptosyltransferase II [Desulfobacteraceae bacterium]|jgi:lipopolysaccharide heptosyltransferase I